MAFASNRDHCKIEMNNVDPDDGNSWLCSACNLPIFATPYVGDGSKGHVLHDQCANLPEELKDCELHPNKPLFLMENNPQQTCSACSQKCGTKLYYCPDSDCGLILDVACAVTVKILHLSHPQHRLVAVKSSFSTCGVCGTTHERKMNSAKDLSYFCNLCGFWIHPECARLPNLIHNYRHDHHLLLYYDPRAAFDADVGVKKPRLFENPIVQHLVKNPVKNPIVDRVKKFLRFKKTKLGDEDPKVKVGDDTDSSAGPGCAICHKVYDMRFGIYYCIFSRDCGYSAHIRCVVSDSMGFHSVLSEAQQDPGWVRLPVVDEHHSYTKDVFQAMMHSNHHIYEKYIYCDDSPFPPDHDHPFTDTRKAEDEYIVCDVCVKLITDPSFYSCTVCPQFFVHRECRRLPTSLQTHNHALKMEISTALVESRCHLCECPSLRVRYHCKETKQHFLLDVSCALMPDHVTHDIHAKGHFLRLSREAKEKSRCDCCGKSLGKLGYECRTCPNFALHTWCAMLPKTVNHKFDAHPLRLTTTPGGVDADANASAMICEICEKIMENVWWCYGCEECDQWFHINCIPCVDLVYKIKSLASSGLYSDPPSRLIRGLTLNGHGEDYCSDVADEYDILLSD